MKKVLTIAGSDSGGGAGIQADIKTISAHGLFALSVITAVTAQNTLGIRDIFPVPEECIGQQLDAVFEDLEPDSIKIGMLSDKGIIDTVSRKLHCYKGANIVLDPVLSAGSGKSLMKDNSVEVMVEKLFPSAFLVTPNIPEACVLANMEIKTKAHIEKAAEIIGKYTNGGVLVKGGHAVFNEGLAEDCLFFKGSIQWFSGKRIKNANNHGTGCTLSSAIASNLAKGMSLKESIKKSKTYLSNCLAFDLNLGAGTGPVNHFYFL